MVDETTGEEEEDVLVIVIQAEGVVGVGLGIRVVHMDLVEVQGVVQGMGPALGDLVLVEQIAVVDLAMGDKKDSEILLELLKDLEIQLEQQKDLEIQLEHKKDSEIRVEDRKDLEILVVVIASLVEVIIKHKKEVDIIIYVIHNMTHHRAK